MPEDNPKEPMSLDEFKAKIEEMYPRLHRAMSAYLAGTELEADDIVQETFLKACRNLATFKGSSGFYTWLYVIAKNICIDTFRKRKYEKNRSDIPADEYELKSDNFNDGHEREEVLLLRKAIAQLPDDLRMLVIMKEIDEMSYPEISVVLNVNEATLRGRMFKARKILAATLNKYGVYEP